MKFSLLTIQKLKVISRTQTTPGGNQQTGNAAGLYTSHISSDDTILATEVNDCWGSEGSVSEFELENP